MTEVETDIAIVGGGLSGMIASMVLARAGFRILSIDPAPAPEPGAQTDLRSTALLMPSIELLKETGVFPALEPFAAPLEAMRIIDLDQDTQAIRASAMFHADEIGESCFGWNVPNAPMRVALHAAMQADPGISILNEDKAERLFARTSSAKLHLASGKTVRAHLVIAADGRNSTLRQGAGIPVTTLRYGQKAIVFHVSHDMPHNAVSTELHASGGPFTLVPLASESGLNSAVVWMTDGPEADRLLALSDTAFEEAATRRTGEIHGRLKLISKRAAWPIISQFARQLVGQRLALIGEAAHVVPPIGAQGLNMSLADVNALRALIMDVAQRSDIGDDKILAAYEMARNTDMRLRVLGIDTLNRASQTGAPPLQSLRGSVLSMLGRTPRVKELAMSMGLGRQPLARPQDWMRQAMSRRP